MSHTTLVAFGDTPRIVTTGLKLPHPLNLSIDSEGRTPLAGGAFAAIAHIDWLSFTITPPDDTGHALDWFFPQLRDVFGIPSMTQTHKVGNWQGYDKVFDLDGFGLLGHGGKSQRGTIHVSLNAAGCARISDWQAVQAWAELRQVRITRADLAHDDLEGKTVNIDVVRQWYADGGFDTGGRPPASHIVGDWLTPGNPKGRTIYIGSKASGKQLCAYEKGRASGDATSPWFRIEGRLGGKKKVIPYDVLTRPGDYLAGMYPCLSYLSVVQEKIKTITKLVSITLTHAQEWLRSTGGKVVNVLLQHYGGDDSAVVKALILPGVPRRLVNYADFLDLAEIPEAT